MKTVNFSELLDKLTKFENAAKPEDFKACFGENLGNHLWNKFSANYKHNLLNLYTSLDLECRRKFSDYIENWEK